MTSLTITLRDAEKKLGQTTFKGGAAATVPEAQTLLAELEENTIGITAYSAVLTNETENTSVPADPYAQYNTRWRFTYKDNVTEAVETVTLATADLSKGTVGTTDQRYIDLAAGDAVTPGTGAALKAAFEDFVVSDAGNPVTLVSVEHVR